MLLFAYSNAIAQDNIEPTVLQVNNSEKCFAECLMGDQYEEQTTDYYVFTGNAEEEVDLETVVLEVKPKTGKWVKKFKSPDCAAPNPDDCWVKCYVTEPAVMEEFKVLKDKTQSDNYTVKSHTAKVLVKKGGYTEEREVLCTDKITPSVVKQLQKALKNMGYDLGRSTKKLNTRTKEALTQYQKRHKLPVGQLDLETLKKLNIEF